MRRRLSVAQEALDELGTPAAMEPPCPTVSNADIKTVGDAWLSSSLLGRKTVPLAGCDRALKEN